MSKRPKILVIGLDGATWDLIKPWADEGKLPTFKGLMEKGSWGELQSVIPPWTVPAWNCLSTGKRPENLGIATFMQREKGSYKFRPYFFGRNEEACFWDYLDNYGKRIHLLFLPNIHKPYKINGTMITGWVYQNKDELTFPSDLKDKLEEVVGEFKIDVVEPDENWRSKSIIGNKEYAEEVRKITAKHLDILEHVLTNYEWDTVFAVFGGSDRIQHKFWQDKNPILNYYRDMDIRLSRLLKLINKDTYLIIVSDHGFGRSDFTFNVNEWLIKENILELASNAQSSGLLRTISNFISNNKPLDSIAQKTIMSLPILKTKVKEKFGSKNFEGLKINWQNTKAFAYGVFGDIYLNLQGREPDGAVDVQEYDRIRNEIIDKLKTLRHPETGENLLISVFTKEELYSDCSINDNQPDIVILVTDDGIQSISPSVGSGKNFRRSSGGDHRLSGVFLAHGPQIKKGERVQGARIYDIAPTILHMFGVPVPEDMDGRVLKQIFEQDSELAERPIKYQKTDERDKIKERVKELKSLGRI